MPACGVSLDLFQVKDTMKISLWSTNHYISSGVVSRCCDDKDELNRTLQVVDDDHYFEYEHCCA